MVGCFCAFGSYSRKHLWNSMRLGGFNFERNALLVVGRPCFNNSCYFVGENQQLWHYYWTDHPVPYSSYHPGSSEIFHNNFALPRYWHFVRFLSTSVLVGLCRRDVEEKDRELCLLWLVVWLLCLLVLSHGHRAKHSGSGYDSFSSPGLWALITYRYVSFFFLFLLFSRLFLSQ